MNASGLFHTAPGRVAWQSVPLPSLGEGQVLVKTDYSAISPGTEAMVFQGRAPRDMALDATLGSLPGTFSYPFPYGYSLVGCVAEVGPNVPEGWLGRRVFLFHPHQDRVVTGLDACMPIPDGISLRAALFLPSMETALSFVMDAAPLVGERVLVFGQGVIGLLTIALLGHFPLQRLIAADPLASRRERSRAWGAQELADPGDVTDWESLRRSLFNGSAHEGADLCFELTGNLEALNQAITMTGFGGRILIGSWYGIAGQRVDLGGPFHRRRISLVSSQVSTLAPGLTGRWDKGRRMEAVWDWIKILAPQTLITHEFHPAEAQQAFELCSARADAVLQTVFHYSTT